MMEAEDFEVFGIDRSLGCDELLQLEILCSPPYLITILWSHRSKLRTWANWHKSRALERLDTWVIQQVQ